MQLNFALMIPTPRLVSLLAFGVVFWVAAAVEHLYIYVAFFYLLIVAAVTFSDWWQSASTKDFELWRVVDELIYLGASNLVQLQVCFRRTKCNTIKYFPNYNPR